MVALKIPLGRGSSEIDTRHFDEIREVLFPSACAALYRNKMLQEIDSFDKDFIASCEDADLGLRARLAGWKALLPPEEGCAFVCLI